MENISQCVVSLLVVVGLTLSISAQEAPYSVTLTFGNNLETEECSCDMDESRMLEAETAINNQQDLINAQQSQLQLMADEVSALKNATNADRSDLKTTYVRWGRTVCPSTSQLVYAGYAGKSYYTHGGGVNYQCLPTDPEFPQNVAGGVQSGAYIYGVEYEGSGSPLMPSSSVNHDAPCAVCLVEGRSTSRMIPAKQSCPEGWTVEYSGFMVSQHNGHKGSTFECLDSEFEHASASSASGSNGGLFYVVEAKCGALPCNPYTDGYELLCVVCTK